MIINLRYVYFILYLLYITYITFIYILISSQIHTKIYLNEVQKVVTKSGVHI